MSIVGDVADTTATFIINKHFAKLPHLDIPNSSYIPSSTHAPTLVKTLVPDKAAIDYMIGIATSITDTHPDYPALLLGMNVLAHWGGFTGRLMQTTREKEGLTYVAYGRLAGFAVADGYISIWSNFAPSTFEKGRASIKRQIKLILEKGIATEEFKKHRAQFEASSRVACADSMSLARAGHDCVRHGKPISHLDTFPQRILRLTKKQVESALKKYLLLNQMTESMAGTDI